MPPEFPTPDSSSSRPKPLQRTKKKEETEGETADYRTALTTAFNTLIVFAPLKYKPKFAQKDTAAALWYYGCKNPSLAPQTYHAETFFISDGLNGLNS